MIDYKAAEKMYREAFGVSEDQNDRWLFLESLHTYVGMLPKPCTVLEIGTLAGKSAFAMACAMHGTGSRLICVDPVFITGEVTCPDAHQNCHTYRSSLVDVVARLAKHNLAHIVSIVPGFSESVFEHWDGTPLDMVMVDGAHTRHHVALDSRWSHYVKPGGMMVYDDWIEDVRDAAISYFERRPDWKLEYESTSAPTSQGWAITMFRRQP